MGPTAYPETSANQFTLRVIHKTDNLNETLLMTASFVKTGTIISMSAYPKFSHSLTDFGKIWHKTRAHNAVP
jgi:hypothetical protein